MMTKLQTRHIFQNAQGNLTKLFFQKKKSKQRSAAEIESFLSHINILKLSEDKAKLCEEDLTKNDLYDFPKIMQNGKSPR